MFGKDNLKMRTRVVRTRGNNETTSKTTDVANANVKAGKDDNNKEEVKGIMDDKVKKYKSTGRPIKKTENHKEVSCVSARDTNSAKNNTKALPLPSTRLTTHKQAAVWSSGKRHKT